MVAVAIDKDKGSQAALKWAVDNLLGKGKNVTLLHVKQKTSSVPTPLGSHVGFSDDGKAPADSQAKELFLPFRCFCTRKDIQVNEVVLEDTDIARALCDYVKNNLIESLVVGSTVKNGFVRRFKTVDIPGSVSKGAPEFCTVYVISKGKAASVRAATIPVPKEAPRQLQNASNPPPGPTNDARFSQGYGTRGASPQPFTAKTIPTEDTDSIK
ncbi:hypothetical protein DH2020_018411 [Rehmannia glutinosa]|uniref:RING-type E3 ubiquitin transferase n=1 Tax=Rehmannia glutinosa TaxID=99300 RepID=A0ABR0WN05_REHGL